MREFPLAIGISYMILDKVEHLGFTQSVDIFVLFNEKICVLDDLKLKREILEDAHKGGFTIHHGSYKMHHDLKKYFWWPEMKSYEY